MPKSKKSKSKEEIELSSSPQLSEEEIPVKNDSKLKKLSKKKIFGLEGNGEGVESSVNNNANIDYGNDFRKMLDVIGTDLNKVMQAKKQRMEQFHTGAIKVNEMKLKNMMKDQAETRKEQHEDLQRNVNSVLEQWNIDVSRLKEQEDKLLKIVQHQIKIIQQARAAQIQRIASIRQIHDSYHKVFLQQNEKENEQCGSVLQELRKELSELQKKLMLESQKEEMVQMQKSLQQSMLFI
ncbi:hypothetical protein ANN_12598 [Periplaneta americana]|uniref:XLR/SYCP3/FAM9 domain-containing protein n=1 Tax=Periplaneta americana TaxID=6978 RepID=A0ABQ8TIX6_PERAM|nr:hypothetical protein ANN_12598 [Periplaneta americana]